MKKELKFFVFMFVVFVSLAISCVQANDKDPKANKVRTKEGEVKTQILAPNFSLIDIYQNIYTLSEYKDKQPVILFFWTTWCPYCQYELKILNQRYSEIISNGFELFSINVGELSDRVMQRVRSYNLAYLVLLDLDTAVSRSYDILGIPTYVLVDKNGLVVFQDNYFPEEMYKDLIAKQPNK